MRNTIPPLPLKSEEGLLQLASACGSLWMGGEVQLDTLKPPPLNIACVGRESRQILADTMHTILGVLFLFNDAKSVLEQPPSPSLAQPYLSLGPVNIILIDYSGHRGH
jgi:hypothetical protein